MTPIRFCHSQTKGAVSNTTSVIKLLRSSAASGASVALAESIACAVALPYSRTSHDPVAEQAMSWNDFAIVTICDTDVLGLIKPVETVTIFADKLLTEELPDDPASVTTVLLIVVPLPKLFPTGRGKTRRAGAPPLSLNCLNVSGPAFIGGSVLLSDGLSLKELNCPGKATGKSGAGSPTGMKPAGLVERSVSLSEGICSVS